MVAIPIANDQLGLAVRLGCSNSSAVVQLKRVAIYRVWGDPYYRQNAQPLTQAIATAFGVARVGNRVKQLFSSSQAEL